MDDQTVLANSDQFDETAPIASRRDGNDRRMNILAPPKARLGIEIVHDLVCPWCFLGVRRLMRTLRRRPDLLFDLTWRPFLLNPDMPRAGMARPDYVIRKFGGEDRARRLYASITEIGRSEGILFRFDRIRRTPSSVDAHRLVRYAARFGQADAMAEALFSAHFTDGLDIGDHALLVAIAARAAWTAQRHAASSPAATKWTRYTPTTCGRTVSASTACRASSSPAATPSRARRSRR